MLIFVILSFSSEIVTSSPYFIYSLLIACKTGAATGIISGLSMGYFYTALPVCIIAGYGFLCYYWLGMMGVGMGVCGVALLIPYFMVLSLYSALMNTSSMIGYANNS
jgi:Na+/H+-translocating membrane pyrophosphatase